MTKARILTTLVLVAVLGTFGAVYQFYFKEKLEMYSRDQELLASLEQTYAELNSTFSGYRPDVLTSAWRDQRQPWNDAVTDRARFFSTGDWYDRETPPENVPILRFWYGEEANRKVNDIYQRLATSLGYGMFPMDIYAQLGVPREQDYQGVDVKVPEINRALGRLSFGISALEMLMDAKATRIDSVVLWPPQDKPEHKNLLKSRTLGLSFQMAMNDLVDLLEEMRTSDRYFSVDALKIEYPYIAYPNEPQIQVQMLMTQIFFKPRPQAQAAPGAPAAGADATTTVAAAAGTNTNLAQSAQALFMQEGRDRPVATREEPGFFGKAWKWFKRFYLGTN